MTHTFASSNAQQRHATTTTASRSGYPSLLAVFLVLSICWTTPWIQPDAAMVVAFVMPTPTHPNLQSLSIISSRPLSFRRRRRRRRLQATTDDNDDDDTIIECDVAIIGGGPAGCTCALYTSRADLSTVILDKNPAVGALAVTSHIANYPGVDRSMAGDELLARMRDQAVTYGTRYERAQVFMMDVLDTNDDDDDDPKAYSNIVYTPDLTVKARSLVLATGAMGRSSPPLPGEKEYLGQGVSYCATCDGAFYRDAPVAVYGATNEAMEEALFLTKFAGVVHWITPINIASCLEKQSDSALECNKLIDEDVLERLLACENVNHIARTKMLSVEGDSSGVTGVRIQKMMGDGAEPEIIPVEGAFIYGAGGGSKPITDFCQSKVALDDKGGVIVDENMETNVKGVFAIGDIRNTAYKQVVVAAADGCIAAMSIEKYLTGRKMVKVDWIHK